MKKLLLLSILLTAFACQDEPQVKTIPGMPKGAIPYQPVLSIGQVPNEPPPSGCGTDVNGVKYCCNSYGNCWRENW